MKNILLLLLVSVFFQQNILANDCTSATQINLCPAVLLNGQTTIGQSNDRASWRFSAASTPVNTIGNDNVYEVNIPVGATNLWVDVSASSTFSVIRTATCAQTYYTTLNTYAAGCRRTSYSVTGVTKLFIWIDHNNGSDINYDISFSIVTGTQVFTKGSILPTGFCTAPLFNPMFGLKYNGAQKTYPLVYSPLNTQGTVCYQLYLKNTSGIEALKKIRFTLGADLTGPAPVASSTPGFYSTGDWIASQPSANVVEYNYVAANGRGDFDGLSAPCHMYEFCFSFTPISNSPVTTNTSYTWWGDGYGDFTIYTGCFATLCNPPSMTCSSTNCTGVGAGGVSTGTGNSTDPFLSVKILNFEVRKEPEVNLLSWATSEERNAFVFEVERSLDGVVFNSIGKVNAFGNSDQIINYTFEDQERPNGKIYYRLKEIDKEGQMSYSNVISVNGISAEISLYPNPASDILTIQSTEAVKEIILITSGGEEIKIEKHINKGESTTLSLKELNKGVYFVKIITEYNSTIQKLVIE